MARKKRSSSSGKRAAATKKATKGRRAKAPAGSGSALSALLANLPSVDVMRRLAEVLPAPGSPQAPPFALAAPEAGAKLQELPVKISTSMDPRLQLALANQRTGKRSLALASTGGGEIAVV